MSSRNQCEPVRSDWWKNRGRELILLDMNIDSNAFLVFWSRKWSEITTSIVRLSYQKLIKFAPDRSTWKGAFGFLRFISASNLEGPINCFSSSSSPFLSIKLDNNNEREHEMCTSNRSVYIGKEEVEGLYSSRSSEDNSDVRTRMSIRSTLRQRWALPHRTIIYLFLFFYVVDNDVVVYLVTIDRQECKYRLLFLYLRFVCPRSMRAIAVSICNVLLVATSLDICTKQSCHSTDIPFLLLLPIIIDGLAKRNKGNEKAVPHD